MPLIGSKGPCVTPTVNGIQHTQGTLPMYAPETQAMIFTRNRIIGSDHDKFFTGALEGLLLNAKHSNFVLCAYHDGWLQGIT